MPMKPEPCLARIIRRKAHESKDYGLKDVILFFPNDPARRNFITSWQWLGQHSEASVDFMAAPNTYPARKGIEEEAVAVALAQYAGENPDFPVDVVQRLPKGWQDKAWRFQP